MTQFKIRDLNDPEMPTFFDSTRKYYKNLITRLNKMGKAIRVGTRYEDGEPVKLLTILKES